MASQGIPRAQVPTPKGVTLRAPTPKGATPRAPTPKEATPKGHIHRAPFHPTRMDNHRPSQSKTLAVSNGQRLGAGRGSRRPQVVLTQPILLLSTSAWELS